MTSEETARLAAGRDIWVSMGIAVSAVSAGFSSFAGLRSLAEATGWAVMAPLFALCVDAYALTAIRVWLATSTRSSHARIFAKRNAIGAILLSLAGNAVWHLIAAGLLSVTWHIVMAVGAVPPVILGLVSHLAVIRRQVDPVVTSRASGTEAVLPPALRTVPSTVPSPVLESVPDDIAANRQVGKTKTLPRHRSASSGRQKRPRYGSAGRPSPETSCGEPCASAGSEPQPRFDTSERRTSNMSNQATGRSLCSDYQCPTNRV